MTNPLIDNIYWDPAHTSASAMNLLTQLTALQAEWDEKRSRFLQQTSTAYKSKASWETLPDYREDPKDLAIGFDPSVPQIDTVLQTVRGQLQYMFPRMNTGRSERIYLEQSSVLVPDPTPATSFLFEEEIFFLRPAFIMGVHPLVVKGTGANPCNLVFRPLVDGLPVFGGGVGNFDDRPGHALYPLITTSESYTTVIWATGSTVIPAGLHTIAVDLISSSLTTATSPANVAPLFNYYSSAIELGTMPVAHVEPSVSYLEIFYQ